MAELNHDNSRSDDVCEKDNHEDGGDDEEGGRWNGVDEALDGRVNEIVEEKAKNTKEDDGLETDTTIDIKREI